MAYADYEYYTTSYLGQSIDEADFPRLALRASSYIDYVTMARARQHDDLEVIKMCCCALAERFQAMETAEKLANQAIAAACSNISSDDAEMQSQTVGDWSKSFRSGGDSASDALGFSQSTRKLLAETVNEWLTGTGLLYSGVKMKL